MTQKHTRLPEKGEEGYGLSQWLIEQSEALSFDEKCARNRRVQNRYDELMQIGEHGHYETMFQVIHEECELAVRRERNK